MTDLTICQILLQSRKRPRTATATRYYRRNHWLEMNWDEVYRLSETIAGALNKAGVKPKDRVALLSDTRLEWWVSDFAIMGLGASTVPVYPNQRAEEIGHILRDSGATCLLLESYNQWLKWKKIRDSCPGIKTVVVFDGHEKLPKAISTWDDLLDQGGEYLQKHPDFYEQSISGQSLDDLATLVYTSGTTGEPRGVILTHRQIHSEVAGVLSTLTLSPQDTSLAFLPFAHVLGRIEGWCAVAAGFTLAFAENADRLRENLLEVKPTFLVAVPRVFEKLRMTILTHVQANPLLGRLFEWAMEVGLEVSRRLQKDEMISPALLAQNALAELLVFRPLQKKLGGRLRFAFSGGAPLAREILDFFHAIGILIIEGYGLTETTAAITANSPSNYKFGSVGRPLPGVELKLAADGEILVRGGQVTPGYHHEAPSSLNFTEGFFHTGDIGEIDRDGFLTLTDRKKDLIKTSTGKFVAPQKIEKLLKLNPFISQALIHGDKEKYVVAVITLNPETIVKYARDHGISYQDYGMLCWHPRIRALIREAVAQVNSQLASYETIKNFTILPREFSIEGGEVTPSLKIKRKFCSEKYRDLIRELYD